ncbi:MAG: hypothetical protein ACRENQ_07165 [Gemmatimonadaceae bacterium]
MRQSTIPLLILGVAAACGGSSAPTPPPPSSGPPHLNFVSGNGATDTIGANLSPALAVQVFSATGSVVPVGTAIHFQSIATPSSSAEVSVGIVGGTDYTNSLDLYTSTAGGVSVGVRLGTHVGAASVVVSVPTLGLVDTARFTVTPGNPADVVVAPLDTGLVVGGTLTASVHATDRGGNPVTLGPVSWSAANISATVTSDGTVTGQAVGRDTIMASAGYISGRVLVSIVPPGRLVGQRASLIVPVPNLVLVNADGSDLRVLTDAPDPGIGLRPRWLPDGGSVVYSAVVGDYATLMRADTAGNIAPVFAAAIPNVTHQADPAPTADGQWLYFGAYDSTCNIYTYCLYRARADGSAPQLIGTGQMVNMDANALRPSPSPDGAMVAFVYNPGGGGTRIRIEDVAADTLTTAELPGAEPAWAPDGSIIAYIAGSGVLTLAAPDGTGAHAITSGSRPYNPLDMLSWSSDGEYLLARAVAGTYDLIDVRTGAVAPLPFASAYVSLSLR